MSEFKGTRGPWVFKKYHRNEEDQGCIENTEGEDVCYFGNDEPYENTSGTAPNEANMALILAAPELLELAIYVRDRIKEDGIYQPLDVAEHDRIIAKALGETK